MRLTVLALLQIYFSVPPVDAPELAAMERWLARVRATARKVGQRRRCLAVIWSR